MVGRPTQRLACALFAIVAAATTIEPTNSSAGVDYGSTINLQNKDGQNTTTLVPLTPEATEKDLDGALFYTTDSNSNNISQSEIAFISCDPSSYPGNIHADTVLSNIYNSGKPSAAILYSTSTGYCNFTSDDAQLNQFAIYSTTNMAEASSQKDNLTALTAGEKLFVRIARSEQNNSGNDPNSQTQGQQNPLGPSPSTAVAMIILYSITGVITALFLVIIVTGAVRAHRHPDRYGPRDVMGRPRQSRARGLGMAILDTIPIVKFGEREQPKPTDVELGSTSDARDVNAANTDTTAPTPTPAATEETQRETTREAGVDHAEGLDSGIAPAAGAAVAAANTSAEEGLGCSICTDDFEKGQDIRVLPCNHKFHPECVDPWLLNVSGTCPLCRVDLRPTTSHTSTDEEAADSDTLAPPLQSDEPANRRHSTLRDVLSFRSRPNASADERISALRRLREQRRNASREGVGSSANASTDDVAQDRRRSKRMSLFGRRRGDSVREESPRYNNR
ncbi:uncharacterized protein N0V89_008800 [Didymosphaeria variabile]|uniref:RING-type domain-containing protein n=1 Tax=Didymosphaeria variabile TaxID=1932322 RepID=A0A9W9C8X8_9PLEO|nr:uncharacterized protein N0V89_008800 [Didymosphaeria variabile]KAJ4350179.1 hypothetical protein N0V89_008800 [Didymosphaeria variabile]